MDAIEKVTPVEIARVPEFLKAIGDCQLLEAPDIDIDDRSIERQPVALHDDREPFKRHEIVPQHRECLPQTIPGVPIVTIAPQSARDLVAGKNVSGGNCEASQQRLGLFATHGQREARWKP